MTTSEGPDGLSAYLKPGTARGRTTEAVTDAMREAILDGVLAPSTWLREDELAQSLGVSRTPVREALRRLSDEGLTVKTAHQGTVVAPMTLEDLLALYVVRENLEGLAARLAAVRGNDVLAATLREINDRIRTAHEAGDVPEVRKVNLEFHRVLRDASSNPYLGRFLQQVEHAVRRLNATTLEAPGRVEEVLAEHEGIITAVAAQDAAAAESAAKAHMRRARELRLNAVLGS
ncbi:GntR family transcriptional regulator [Georgenia sp. Z1491]|uniref:GntR family transcriptional regulator n=1 Tax=Georgenia sp. Z1491 TaxID=3416707 RepID=UPI003CF3C06A